MKLKLVDILPVCWITAMVLAPALVMGGIIWHKHLEFVAVQSVMAYDAAQGAIASSSSALAAPPSSPNTCLLSSAAPSLALGLLSTRTYMVIGGMVIGLCARGMAAWFGRRVAWAYRLYRTAVLKEQVATLERLWQEGM